MHLNGKSLKLDLDACVKMVFYFILYSENQCISKLDKIGISLI